ncbi:uncharacterized protein LOC110367854 [Fundulus heteroclitus]|uniref:uncharacterized protein LOC110367854 n=1 Tax=Fundulus heteroclitus TaxID=8078 RepID=UPI00165B0D9B|nr:uncharacterized protein LOC110367854 [Fundulus heteroclitus]
MQAALKKLSSSTKPAVPETQDQLLPPRPPVEPSDEELMRASGDTEKSSDNDAEAGPSTSSLPQGEPAVSAELGDPTDQELLEASAEGRASVQPLDPPEPPSRQDAQLRRDPLSAAEAGPPTASLSQRDPGVSVLGQPNDEELLEAPEPPTRQDVLSRRDPPSAAELLPSPGGQLSVQSSRTGSTGRCL